MCAEMRNECVIQNTHRVTLHMLYANIVKEAPAKPD